MRVWLEFLDMFFLVFHTLLLLFSFLGWVWKKTRKANLVLLLLIGFSWFVLGIWYGIGYCPCTDWHWEVKAQLGHLNMPTSYIKFLVDSITGMDFDSGILDAITAAGFFMALIISAGLNYRDCRFRGNHT